MAQTGDSTPSKGTRAKSPRSKRSAGASATKSEAKPAAKPRTRQSAVKATSKAASKPASANGATKSKATASAAKTKAATAKTASTKAATAKSAAKTTSKSPAKSSAKAPAKNTAARTTGKAKTPARSAAAARASSRAKTATNAASQSVQGAASVSSKPMQAVVTPDKPDTPPTPKPAEHVKRAPTEPDARPLEDYTINDPEAFAENLGKFVEQSGRVWAAYLKPREEGEARAVQADEMGEVVKTLSQVSEYWLSDPKRLLEAQTRLWSGFFDLWTGSMARVSGENPKPVIEPDARDRRFKDPEWSRNQFFDTLKQAYLLLSSWADELVDEASDLDPHTRHKAQFYVKQIASALAPTNFVGTNPELIKETLSSNGENLVRGLSMLAEDLQEGQGDLKVRMTDTRKFKVGENMAMTPGKVVMRNDVCELIQYAPTTDTVLKRPLLMVPPWINKFYILDLNPQKSFIKWAVAQGHSVFVISWINPNEKQAQKGFEHYMREGIMESLTAIEDITGERQVNAAGYCVGGTLLSVTLAYMAATDDDRIASATLFTTQVDFTHAGDLKVFVDEEQLKVMEEQMARKGYLDGKKMSSAFNMLRANDLIWPYVINNYLKGKDPLPFDLLYWNSDSTRMPAANHLFYLRNCYLENTLSRGKMVLEDVKLDLADVKVPVYNLATREDHIAPPQSVFLGSQFFGGNVRFVLSGSGHIAGVINPPDKNKYQYWTGDEPRGHYENWVSKADETPGSWWPDWQAWTESLDGKRVKPPKMGSQVYKPIMDAPGSYVLIKA
jgi:polyhydroxyalkanoate synthase